MGAQLTDLVEKYEVKGDAAILANIREQFAAAMGDSLDSKTVLQLTMILDEGLANVIKHGTGEEEEFRGYAEVLYHEGYVQIRFVTYKPAVPEAIEGEVTTKAMESAFGNAVAAAQMRRVVYELAAQGQVIDLKDPELGKKSGLGLFMIKSLSDSARVMYRSDGSNVVTITKNVDYNP